MRMNSPQFPELDSARSTCDVLGTQLHLAVERTNSTFLCYENELESSRRRIADLSVACLAADNSIVHLSSRVVTLQQERAAFAAVRGRMEKYQESGQGYLHTHYFHFV
jgi:hypothetical protein